MKLLTEATVYSQEISYKAYTNNGGSEIDDWETEDNVSKREEKFKKGENKLERILIEEFCNVFFESLKPGHHIKAPPIKTTLTNLRN